METIIQEVDVKGVLIKSNLPVIYETVFQPFGAVG